ncbi:MAG TPA: lactate racemase domain-containing protein [Myxococcota bacterium]|nr:lactate racemase domain-containing protein [Myxococcota bacterium]
MNHTTVPFGAWHAEETLELVFPDGFEVRRMDPDDAPALDDAAIEAAFARPIGAPRLRDAVRGRATAAVAVDDLTRPTPAHRVLPFVMAELEAAGIPRERTRIVLGTAAHRPMGAAEVERKLGREIAGRYAIVHHDFLGDDLVDLGWHEGGPVHLARAFVEAEARVCVGGVIPHNETGFGGGSKMVLPGLAGSLTIAHFHGALAPRLAGEIEAAPGRLDRRAWSESVARKLGVDAIVGCVVNAHRELAGVHVGDLVAAHRAAAAQAKALGRTRVSRALAAACDVVVVNAYPLDTDPIQMGKSLNLASKIDARCTVVVNAASDGVFYHGMGMGSGVQPSRLLAGVPRWLREPRRPAAWARGMLRGARHPRLAARLSYFSLNPLAWSAFQAGDGQLPPDGDLPDTDPAEADPLVLSRRFPAWGFRRKFGGGRLYREWDALAAALAERVPNARVLVFPCAPLQLVELVDGDDGAGA